MLWKPEVIEYFTGENGVFRKWRRRADGIARGADYDCKLCIEFIYCSRCPVVIFTGDGCVKNHYYNDFIHVDDEYKKE